MMATTLCSYDSVVSTASSQYPYSYSCTEEERAVRRFTAACLMGGVGDFITYQAPHALQKIMLSRATPWWLSPHEEVLEHLRTIVSGYFATGSDPYYMALALLASHLQVKAARPSPCVGCVYVKNQQIIGWGLTDPYGGVHGEIRAAVGDNSPTPVKDLSGTSVYVILEPCCHRPASSCSQFLIKHQVARVVIGVIDPDPRMNGAGVAMLAAAGIQVEVGLLGVASSRLLQPYLYNRRAAGRVYLGAKWAQSMDGRLAAPSGQSQWISKPSSLVYSQWLRYIYDGVMVGSQTFITDRPSLGLRHPFMIGQQPPPLKIIFDPYLKAFIHPCFEAHYNYLKADGAQVVWLSTIGAGQRWLAARRAHAEHYFYRLDEHNQALFWFKLDDHEIIASLIDLMSGRTWQSDLGVRYLSVLVEGGPRLHGLLLGQGCYQMLHVVTSAKWLGGEHGIQPVGPVVPHAINTETLPYDWVVSHTFDGDILSEYARRT